ncbi:Uncharacterised protein [Edwardsiella ictaluri]|nr:Uncharacterised protein [Edwardsiella ictaluri]
MALGSLYDPADPMGKIFFNVLATLAEFEGDLIRLCTREGMSIAGQKEIFGECGKNCRVNNKKSYAG